MLEIISLADYILLADEAALSNIKNDNSADERDSGGGD